MHQRSQSLPAESPAEAALVEVNGDLVSETEAKKPEGEMNLLEPVHGIPSMDELISLLASHLDNRQDEDHDDEDELIFHLDLLRERFSELNELFKKYPHLFRNKPEEDNHNEDDETKAYRTQINSLIDVLNKQVDELYENAADLENLLISGIVRYHPERFYYGLTKRVYDQAFANDSTSIVEEPRKPNYTLSELLNAAAYGYASGGHKVRALHMYRNSTFPECKKILISIISGFTQECYVAEAFELLDLPELADNPEDHSAVLNIMADILAYNHFNTQVDELLEIVKRKYPSQVPIVLRALAFGFQSIGNVKGADNISDLALREYPEEAKAVGGCLVAAFDEGAYKYLLYFFKLKLAQLKPSNNIDPWSLEEVDPLDQVFVAHNRTQYDVEYLFDAVVNKRIPWKSFSDPNTRHPFDDEDKDVILSCLQRFVQRKRCSIGFLQKEKDEELTIDRLKMISAQDPIIIREELIEEGSKSAASGEKKYKYSIWSFSHEVEIVDDREVEVLTIKSLSEEEGLVFAGFEFKGGVLIGNSNPLLTPAIFKIVEKYHDLDRQLIPYDGNPHEHGDPALEDTEELNAQLRGGNEALEIAQLFAIAEARQRGADQAAQPVSSGEAAVSQEVQRSISSPPPPSVVSPEVNAVSRVSAASALQNPLIAPASSALDQNRLFSGSYVRPKLMLSDGRVIEYFSRIEGFTLIRNNTLVRSFGQGQNRAVTCIELLADGHNIAVGSGFSHDDIRIYNPDTGALVRSISQNNESVSCMIVRVDGNIVVGTNNPQGNIRVYDSTTGTLMRSFSQGGIGFENPGRLIDKINELWPIASRLPSQYHARGAFRRPDPLMLL